MDSTRVMIQLLEKKVSYLKEQYSEQQARIAQLEKENEKLAHKIAQHQGSYQLPSHPQLLTTLLPSLPANDPAYAGTLKNQLEQHIRWIDACIAFIQEM